MMLTIVAAFALAAGPQEDALESASPHRQFDFWIGEWSVQNRHIQPDGSWRDGDVTRARITPVVGGNAIFEEWAGPFHGSFMNGFSLRAYDPARRDWDLLLFWTTDGNSGFGKLRGAFRHGRGEFFSRSTDGEGVETITRYSFSDTLPQSIRWDSARSTDAGKSWSTDWIMEFSRTRAAELVTQPGLFSVDWNPGRLSPHAEARKLDWLLGEWRGKQTNLTNDVEREARLTTTLVSKDCLFVDLLETLEPGGEDWDERLSVRGFVAQRGAWESWTISETDTVLRRSLGQPGESVAVFEASDARGVARRETIRRIGESELVIEAEERSDGELELVRVTEMWKAR